MVKCRSFQKTTFVPSQGLRQSGQAVPPQSLRFLSAKSLTSLHPCLSQSFSCGPSVCGGFRPVCQTRCIPFLMMMSEGRADLEHLPWMFHRASWRWLSRHFFVEMILRVATRFNAYQLGKMAGAASVDFEECLTFVLPSVQTYQQTSFECPSSRAAVALAFLVFRIDCA